MSPAAQQVATPNRRELTTVAILPIFDADGEKTYRAIAGDKHSVGKTAGQALDALTTQLGQKRQGSRGQGAGGRGRD